MGYPIEQIASENRGKMHQVGPGSFQFEVVSNQIYRSFDLKSYPGNSGGPLCVYAATTTGQPFFIPAAVYLGGAGQTVVRAIDRDVADIINQAEAASAAGGNSTGGGVVNWNAGPTAAPPFSPPLFRVHLSPVMANPPGWRISGDVAWNTNYDTWFYTSNASVNANLLLEFKDAGSGFITPASYLTNLNNTLAPVPPDVVRSATIPAAYIPVSQAQLGVTPITNFAASGTSGGPFTPSSVVLTLTNSGGQQMTWGVGNSANWLTLSASSGTLDGGTATNVTVSINTNAAALAIGNYTNTLTFQNFSVGALGTTNRNVTLTVIANVPLRLGAPVKLVSGDYSLTLTGPSGRAYAIELSTNLLSWTNVLMLTNTTGTNIFTNPPAPNSPKGFYRARQTP